LVGKLLRYRGCGTSPGPLTLITGGIPFVTCKDEEQERSRRSPWLGLGKLSLHKNLIVAVLVDKMQAQSTSRLLFDSITRRESYLYVRTKQSSHLADSHFNDRLPPALSNVFNRGKDVTGPCIPIVLRRYQLHSNSTVQVSCWQSIVPTRRMPCRPSTVEKA
jgi:hypothetical protein